MEVGELRDALAQRGLETDGLKPLLRNRLQAQLDVETRGITVALPHARATTVTGLSAAAAMCAVAGSPAAAEASKPPRGRSMAYAKIAAKKTVYLSFDIEPGGGRVRHPPNVW